MFLSMLSLRRGARNAVRSGIDSVVTTVVVAIPASMLSIFTPSTNVFPVSSWYLGSRVSHATGTASRKRDGPGGDPILAYGVAIIDNTHFAVLIARPGAAAEATGSDRYRVLLRGGYGV